MHVFFLLGKKRKKKKDDDLEQTIYIRTFVMLEPFCFPWKSEKFSALLRWLGQIINWQITIYPQTMI